MPRRFAVPSEATLSAGRRGALAVALLFLVAACSAGPDRTAAASRIGARPSGATIATTQPALHKSCLEPGERSAELWFDATDGTRLSGVTLGQGTTGVVLAHQHWSNLCTWMPLARELAHNGYRVLAFDFRGYGASPAPDRKTARWLDQDVAGAIRELRRLGAERAVLVGASMGATASLVEAAQPTHGPELPVAGIVSVSGPARFFGMDAEAAAKRLRTRLLFIASKRDGMFTNTAKELYRLAPATDKRLVIVPGNGHGTGLINVGAYAARLRALILAFVAGEPISSSGVPVDLGGDSGPVRGGPGPARGQGQRTMRPSRYAAQ
jgi:pimeloyl-ACP methyl ester carboxylesterase